MEMDKATCQFWDFFLHKDHDLDENFYTAQLPWRNWLARSTVNRKVGGSSPPGSGVLRVICAETVDTKSTMLLPRRHT